MYGTVGGRTCDRPRRGNVLERIWPNYFPETEFSEDDRRFKLISQLCDSLGVSSQPREESILSQVKDDDGIVHLPLDFQHIKECCRDEELYAALEVAPKEALLCVGAAVHELLVYQGKECILGDQEKINVRLYNHFESMINLKSLKAAYIGKLVSIRGTVVKVSTVKPLVVQMSFTCGKCGAAIMRMFPDGKYSPPAACIYHGCKSRTFTPNRSTARLVDSQKIRLQELLRAENHEEGRMPRTIECELTEDLVDSCIPGDVMTVTGIIKVINSYMDIKGGKSKNKNQGLYYLYLEAISVRNSKNPSAKDLQVTNGTAKELHELHKFSPRDLEFIARFLQEHGSDIFRQILHSICPSIYGHELVKAGITLALFGGVRKHVMDQNSVPIRGDIHVIIVGDPGLGKSQLLQAAAAVVPRGIYVCGNATTNAGLTVAVVKDPATSDYAFEAGAMVLADGGLCCIDEFDKMSAEHQALLEAMEQQCVSVAKAGLVASLSARASILAAANPVGGHYNRAKTVNENLKMSPALLSRFDLVFILLDKPDELLDKRLSDHIIALRAGCGECPQDPRKLDGRALQSDKDGKLVFKGGSLASRLRLDPREDKDFAPLPVPLLRKYITYARNYIFPRMSKSAAEILKKFYLQLRGYNVSADSTPITARQLESLVRLAEARARLELREEIIAEDALDVVEIMKESLYNKYVDEHGTVDFARSGGMSKEKEAKRFLNALHQQSEIQHKDCFSVSEMYTLADQIGLRVPDIDTFIDNLNSVGYLLKKGPKTYQVLSSSYCRSQPSRSRC
ncbi:probable DNA helicase MCM8 isoform X2 [Nymphaea colorata]|uniref:probable DNA helicase MCM8 isoform X2 n=1 Tax=Nymphaea colorata TaxID=210225 RepID=UPI00129E7E8C|nr:probable DNA helicase MCM8 isoform X2 [Nymphaea colorata]